MDFRKTCYAICQDCIVQLGFFCESGEQAVKNNNIRRLGVQRSKWYVKKKGWI